LQLLPEDGDGCWRHGTPEVGIVKPQTSINQAWSSVFIVAPNFALSGLLKGVYSVKENMMVPGPQYSHYSGVKHQLKLMELVEKSFQES
jgi:hypothetical protein